VRGHDHGDGGIYCRREGHEFLGDQALACAIKARQIQVRVDAGVSVSGEMLRTREHAARMQATHKRAGHSRNLMRIAAKAATGCNRAIRIRCQIQHRREIQIDASGAQFTRHGAGHFFDRGGISQTADVGRRRPVCKGLAQRKFRAAFLIDADQHRATRSLANCARQSAEFVHISEVARIKRNASQPPGEHPSQFRRKLGAGETEHEVLEKDLRFWRRRAHEFDLCYTANAIMPDLLPSRGRRRENNLRIETRAPTRIDLAGGTLDIWPLYLFHPGALTVNCAITRYASCVVETQAGSGIRLVSRDTKRDERFASLAALDRATNYRLPLLAHLVRFFRPKTGLTVTTDSQAPAGAGIGGSSAMAVALCAALDRLTGAGLRLENWIHISRDAEAIVIRVPTGTQDHYPPAFGGASAIHLEPGGERREEVGCDLDELERRLVLCYTGKPRKHGINNWEVFERHIRGDKRVFGNLARIAEVAKQVFKALNGNHWEETGKLIREEWEFRRRNLPTISTPVIDRIISAARRQGALAGKVCGAGGGGCVALLIDPEATARVEAAIVANGGELLPQGIDREGVRIRVGRKARLAR
jgi:D-glycero-alpha-D-manno-heptose-7-phosphate kinase